MPSHGVAAFSSGDYVPGKVGVAFTRHSKHAIAASALGSKEERGGSRPKKSRPKDELSMGKHVAKHLMNKKNLAKFLQPPKKVAAGMLQTSQEFYSMSVQERALLEAVHERALETSKTRSLPSNADRIQDINRRLEAICPQRHWNREYQNLVDQGFLFHSICDFVSVFAQS